MLSSHLQQFPPCPSKTPTIGVVRRIHRRSVPHHPPGQRIHQVRRRDPGTKQHRVAPVDFSVSTSTPCLPAHPIGPQDGEGPTQAEPAPQTQLHVQSERSNAHGPGCRHRGRPDALPERLHGCDQAERLGRQCVRPCSPTATQPPAIFLKHQFSDSRICICIGIMVDGDERIYFYAGGAIPILYTRARWR